MGWSGLVFRLPAGCEVCRGMWEMRAETGCSAGVVPRGRKAGLAGPKSEVIRRQSTVGGES